MKLKDQPASAEQESAVSPACVSPIPVSRWESAGNLWPTVHGWYNMLRPENQRDELINSGVVGRVNGRWVIFPDAWQRWCKSSQRARAES